MSRVSDLTGLPKLPSWIYKIFLNFPGLLPCKIKWKAASKGIGLLVTQLGGEEGESTSAALRELGRKQGSAIANELGIGKNVKEVMQVTVLANRIFGTMSSIEKAEEQTGRTIVSKCAWAGSQWGPKPCALLSAYEVGLVEGLNPNVKTKYLKKMSRGDECCLTEYLIS